jgi:hypothetical protein
LRVIRVLVLFEFVCEASALVQLLVCEEDRGAAPLLKNFWAIALPTVLAAPVMTATLLASSNLHVYMLSNIGNAQNVE